MCLSLSLSLSLCPYSYIHTIIIYIYRVLPRWIHSRRLHTNSVLKSGGSPFSPPAFLGRGKGDQRGTTCSFCSFLFPEPLYPETTKCFKPMLQGKLTLDIESMRQTNQTSRTNLREKAAKNQCPGRKRYALPTGLPRLMGYDNSPEVRNGPRKEPAKHAAQGWKPKHFARSPNTSRGRDPICAWLRFAGQQQGMSCPPMPFPQHTGGMLFLQGAPKWWLSF